MKYDYIATVEIFSHKEIEEIAQELSWAFVGFDFVADDGERFEEVPAYIAQVKNIQLILLGAQDDIESDYFILKLYCVDDLDISDYSFDRGFLDIFPIDNPNVESTGYVDISGKMVDFINLNTDLKCDLPE